MRRADAEPRVSHRHQDRHPLRPVRQGGALFSGKKEPIMERDRRDEKGGEGGHVSEIVNFFKVNNEGCYEE